MHDLGIIGASGANTRASWRLRVWAWRLGLLCVVSAVPMCATRQIREDCVRRIQAARTEAEVDAIAAECHRVLEVRR